MTQKKSNFLIAVALIIFAAILKVITYPNSFTPIIAIALFSGVVITDRKLAFAMPLLAMFVSDLMMEVFNIAQGFYGWGQIGNYAALLFVTVLGFSMKKINVLNVVGYSIVSSLLFFFLSNSNSFIFDTFNLYERSFAGWIKCLGAGLPFLKNRIPTDLIYSALLFGSYVLVFRPAHKKVVA